MGDIVRETDAMIRCTTPECLKRRDHFRTVPDAATTENPGRARAVFPDTEGVSFVFPVPDDITGPQAKRRITLGVPSKPGDAGLAAVISSTLARQCISCNNVAAHHHDHVFGPEDRTKDAFAALTGLSATGNSTRRRDP